jgi:PASTA domain/IPT/TIG domain
VRKVYRVSALVAAVATLAICSSAQAAPVTVGSPLTGNYSSFEIGFSFGVFNTKVPGNTTSPVSGAIVGWNLLGASGGPFTLRVLQPVGATEYTGFGSSAPVTPLTTGPQHFATNVPIKAGQTIAFDHANSSDHIGIATAAVSGGKLGFFSAPLAEGATATAISGAGDEAAFNAEVQPAPVVAALSTTSGPVSGGTSVLIAGTDLENTTSVTFGSTPATFAQSTESAVVATSPPRAVAGSVPITVTTLAGSSTSSQAFTYQASPSAPGTGTHCVVPNLAGKKLSTAKSRLKAAACKLGKVTKKKGATTKTGKVVKQSPKAAKVLAAGTKVKVTLGG